MPQIIQMKGIKITAFCINKGRETIHSSKRQIKLSSSQITTCQVNQGNVMSLTLLCKNNWDDILWNLAGVKF